MMHCPEPFDLLAQEIESSLFVSERHRKRPKGDNAIGMQIFRPEQIIIERRLPEDLVPVPNQLPGSKTRSTRPSDCRRDRLNAHRRQRSVQSARKLEFRPLNRSESRRSAA